MNTKLIIWIVGILLGVVIIALGWYVFSASKTVPQTTAQPTPTTLPMSGSVGPIRQPTSSPGTTSPSVRAMTLATQDGQAIQVIDFIHNGATIPDSANVGHYLLAGNLGYCLSNPKDCQAAPATDFAVYYNSMLQSFTITLTREPIGQSRLDMEQFMLVTLGLTQLQLCDLNYYVGVTKYINSQFTGKNLGFSFCPGATTLPK